MPDAATLLRMKAEREGRSRRAAFGGLPGAGFVVETANSGATTTLVSVRFEGPLLLPVRLRIPWSALVSDNDKYTVNPRKRGSLILTPEYREAKRRIAALAVGAMQDRPAAQCPLALVARVWLPNRRKHDVCNFSKCVHDALAGIVYQDDMWLHDMRWIRAGVDVDAPRCELTITPLTPAA